MEKHGNAYVVWGKSESYVANLESRGFTILEEKNAKTKLIYGNNLGFVLGNIWGNEILVLFDYKEDASKNKELRNKINELEEITRNF